jgi:hydroxymethylpyrimidine pyrophosphatase-like HAD family hydrolase
MSAARPHLLLCTDLDRTLLPNGPQPESPGARELLARLAARPEVTLVFVTGRDRGRVEGALREWALPAPDLVVADVGTTIYDLRGGGWQRWAAWGEAIARDWRGRTHAELAAALADLPALVPQEPSRQSRFKLSYQVALAAGGDASRAAAPAAGGGLGAGRDAAPAGPLGAGRASGGSRAGELPGAPLDASRAALDDAVAARLAALGVQASRIWSVDEAAGVGLLDVLPARATKQHAVAFVREALAVPLADTLFAGDSGNDLAVLVSPIPAVLVANAHPEVAAEALRRSEAQGTRAALYLARGGWRGLNGCYAAGILEGVAHYHSQRLEAWLGGATPPPAGRDAA